MVRATDGTGQAGHATPRHVWVVTPEGRRCPGVLMEWRQGGGRWEALVTYADGGGVAPVNAQIAWVPAEHVELHEPQV
ncbi:hypothetical protein [Nocardioides sp. T2.26MG-1]|uniref:hypothetical protein n=1 Tax=Nocardioides sp. T2.26MG-1 TaxID=3041166 RepID=UPI0024776281|nr:hypothetical protein [Nocardioides sp. T2.26MG-1]CAI9417459.1 hypothetical protein HIDPHFAB_03025 [Nocardioides sp. T2.26MG-1]